MPVSNLASGALLAINSLGTSLLPRAPPTISSVADIEAKINLELAISINGLYALVTAFASKGPGTVAEALVRSLATFPMPNFADNGPNFVEISQ